jgi:hypothetical protein
MRDRFEAELWASHGEDFSRDLHAAFRRLGRGLGRLNSLQWTAPWKKASRRSRPGLA